MEIVGLLITAGASQAVQALVKGRGPRVDELAGVASGAVEQLLGAMLKAQDETARTLSRMEAKIDQMAAAPYRNAMGTGYRNLQMAQPAHRSAADRSRLIDEALQQFISAAAAAQETDAPLDAVFQAELLIAACWLAKGSPTDFHAVTREASIRVFERMLEELDRSEKSRFAQYLAESKTGPIRRTLHGLRPKELEEAAAEWKQKVVAPVVELFRRFNDVQQLRRTYGAQPIDSPRQLGVTNAFPGAGIGLPGEARRMSLQYRPVLEQPARFLGTTVVVSDAVLRPRRPGGSGHKPGTFMVDAVLELGGFGEYSAGAGWPDRAWSVDEKNAPLAPKTEVRRWNGKSAKTEGQVVRLALRTCAHDEEPRQLAVDVRPSVETGPRVQWPGFFVCQPLSVSEGSTRVRRRVVPRT